jgi:hypothetical protein
MSDTDEHPPLQVDGHFQWRNLPTYAKWLAAALAVFAGVANPLWSHWRISRAQDDAKVAEIKARTATATTTLDKAEADSGWKLLKPRVEALEAWKHEREVAEARAEAARRKALQRRPVPVVVPPAPKPLPPTLKAALEQVSKQGPNGAVIIPIPPPDGGQ